LHHAGNRLPRWLLETIGVHVSAINGCEYCVAHHAAGLRRLVGDARVEAILEALRNQVPEGALSAREAALVRYADKLTRAPSTMTEDDVATLRAHGLDDGEILEANQVAAYFAYVNRVVLGLGVTPAGEELGLSPQTTDDGTDWTHR
jgi:uncharacterized peroxidase-related enzyme